MSEFLRLKKSNCKNCYKCIRHCPVKSIKFSGHQAHIVPDECVLCGQCVVVCPQNAKHITSDVEKVKVMIYGVQPVVVSLAPSFVANYGVGIGAMEKALKQLGFTAVEETAIGATMVKRQYDELLSHAAGSVMISSCCHSVNLLAQKHFPSTLQYLAPVVSPMIAHAMDLKKRHSNCKTVFIGPCLAKKDEAERYGEGGVDAVLTFEELSEWLKAEDISIEHSIDQSEESRARFFPVPGGILKTMECENPQYDYMAVDGMENCIAVLRDVERGLLSNVFIELSACTGSCVGGPAMEGKPSPVGNYKKVSRYAGEKDFAVEQLSRLEHYFAPINTNQKIPNEQELHDILKQMGKEEVQLNCGSCGYNTCLEKAIAVYQGKADLSMCLPFLKEKAESFSDTIINNTPNGIIVLNEELEVQQINRAALGILNIRQANDVLGEEVIRILDPQPFIKVKESRAYSKEEQVYLAEYNKFVEQTIIYDKDYHIIMCIMRDVTDSETARKERETFSQQTIQVADQVVEKQMRIVQEIASLLGETAAETKIALTKLKESISNE